MTSLTGTRIRRRWIAAVAVATATLAALAAAGSAPAGAAAGRPASTLDRSFGGLVEHDLLRRVARRAQTPGALEVDLESVRPGSSASPRSRLPGFVLERGRFTAFETADPSVRLAPGGVNDRGEIAGEFLAPTRESGFLRDKRGRITKIDVRGAAGTQVEKINNRGQIVGAYNETSPFLPNPDAGSRGFVLTRGRATRIDAPGATSTVPHGINDHGQVVGVYEDRNGRDRGFVWTHGRFTTFDVPGASFTEAAAINNHGRIVGIYGDADGAIHGFLRSNRAYRTIDPPGAAFTFPFAINDRGQVVGSMSTDPSGLPVHGFLLRRGVDGPLTQIDVPGAPNTLPLAINHRGQIVGAYENPNAPQSSASARARSRAPVPMPGLLAGLGR
jgi:probable HAF family extracellular repeat protein